MEIIIDPSVTPEQQQDLRFKKLLRDVQYFFNSRENDRYKLMLGLHEAGHIYYAKLAGATDIKKYGPRMMWDSRPQYNCPAISRSSVGWIPYGGFTLANLKADIAGYIVRRELSGKPNDHIAIERDLHGARERFDEHVGTGDDAFNGLVAKAEAEILIDLRNPAIRHAIWEEARLFLREVFPQTKPSLDVKTSFSQDQSGPCWTNQSSKVADFCTSTGMTRVGRGL
jgi:hypothetical protein